eukprot:TRINITY_DN48206_c0_g1_i1.p1 TRINITY_DN48206_c0_g1~~TRINITY_DN48206_c0_g1_i1.p1  ORF type:complete len:374 (+),score=51.56 TRINITY_DN48206_c0_g1_i1:138-1124(+)
MPNEQVVAILNDVAPDSARHVRVIPPMDPSQLPAAWEMLVKYCDAVGIAQRDPQHLEDLFSATIEKLAHDNVMYCELRVGLKATPTKREFLALLTRIINEQHARFPQTTVKLLISVNRHGDMSQGEENVDVAIDSFLNDRTSAVCGVELGGVATSGSFKELRHIFQKARNAGLRVALHCGEDRSKQHEWTDMIAFSPDRLGHCVHCDDDNVARIIASRIPVETCLTCHQRHFGVPVKHNIFGKMHPSRQAVVCTDNPSIYEVMLTDEYELLCCAYDLTISDVFELARRAIDFSFQSLEAKDEMKADFDARIRNIRTKLGIRSALAGKL